MSNKIVSIYKVIQVIQVMHISEQYVTKDNIVIINTKVSHIM